MAEFSGRDVDHLILNDPAEYERLLHSYSLLLGQRKMWWERVAEAEDETWKSCVRAAISQVAQKCSLPAKVLARYLDIAEMPKSRALVLQIARTRLRGW